MHNKVLYNLKAPSEDEETKKNKKFFYVLFIIILIFGLSMLSWLREPEPEVVVVVVKEKKKEKFPELISGNLEPDKNLCDLDHIRWIYYSVKSNSFYLCLPNFQWKYLTKLFD
jgi:hypothetical protein